jgi:hypothetical protein
MVVIGSYPYQHTLTLEQLYNNTGSKYIYYVDIDKIVRLEEIPTVGITIDSLYHIAYGEDVGRTIDCYRSQNIPPPMPENISRPSEKYQKDIDAVIDAAICLVVNDNTSTIMEGTGAIWNPHLCTWILDAEHLHMLRDKRKRKFDGKVHKVSHVDNTYKVYGDLSSHIHRLKGIDAIYNEDDDTWIVKTSKIHLIADLFKK